MTSYFPDINVWIALSLQSHPQSAGGWEWLNQTAADDALFFSRHTQLGFLRLLCSQQVVAEPDFTVRRVWSLFHELAADSRVRLVPEPHGLSQVFEGICLSRGRERAPKFIADAYLIAFARCAGFTLVTFDHAMARTARANHCAVLRPA